MSQVEEDRSKETEEKKAALKRVAELESLNSELGQLHAEVEALTEQLQSASAARQAQQQEIQGFRQQVDALESKNASLLASCAAAEEQEAQLKVGPSAGLPHCCPGMRKRRLIPKTVSLLLPCPSVVWAAHMPDCPGVCCKWNADGEQRSHGYQERAGVCIDRLGLSWLSKSLMAVSEQMRLQL